MRRARGVNIPVPSFSLQGFTAGELSGCVLFAALWSSCGSFRKLGVPCFGGPYIKDPTIKDPTI